MRYRYNTQIHYACAIIIFSKLWKGKKIRREEKKRAKLYTNVLHESSFREQT